MSHLSGWERKHLLNLRVAEGMREVGVLLIAFAPLDAVLGGGGWRKDWPAMVGFAVAGLLLFVASIILEWRLHDAK